MTPIRLDALLHTGEYRSRNTELVADTAGVPRAELSVVPRLLVTRALAAQRKAVPLPTAERAAALTRAAAIFCDDTIAGLDFDDYVALTHRISGVPVAAAAAGARSVVDALRSAFDAARLARPVGSTEGRHDVPAAGGAVWTRRGEVLAVHAPGNAPGVHGLWPQALALGYRVAVRPSRREPLTAHRLVTALRRAGFGDTDVLFVPTDYAGADELVRAADLAMVYGGPDVAARYAADPTVLVNGPGRSKILVTAEHDWRTHLDDIVTSICAFGGMACVNATAVLYEGDAAPLAHAIAERLAALPDDALPTVSLATAQALSTHLARAASGPGDAVAVLGADQVVANRGDGSAVLRPALHLLRTPDPATLNVELPFPCVWVAPWRRDPTGAAAMAPLRDSLVLNLVTSDDQVIDLAVADPSVVNVFVGRVSTVHSAAHIPSEGFLADFLMRNKGYLHA